MKALVQESVSSETAQVEDLVMKAVIISDAFTFSAKATAALRRIAHISGVNVQWSVKCWPTNVLAESALSEIALDAHLIVFPRRLAESRQSSLVRWLERWAAVRQTQDAALGIINEDDAAASAAPMSPELFGLVRQYDLTVIMDESPATKSTEQLPVHFSGERELSLPVARPHFSAVAKGHSYRGYGINE